VPYSDLIEKIEIIENGSTFKENAIIKATRIFSVLRKNGFADEVVLADDSGISVEALKWQPNIKSARYAGQDATSEDNLQKMINELKKINVKSSRSFYTAAISFVNSNGEVYTTHGWMHGKVITVKMGDGGFGYDPIFIPDGENQTLGILSNEVKNKYSHRIQALKLMQNVFSAIGLSQ
jgi:XTP/dITP diphosphohydrolase